jgi:hypothetical protein
MAMGWNEKMTNRPETKFSTGVKTGKMSEGFASGIAIIWDEKTPEISTAESGGWAPGSRPSAIDGFSQGVGDESSP